MGLFDRFLGKSQGSTPSAPVAYAVVTESRMASDAEHETGVQRNHSVERNELNALGLGTIPHLLTLEVHIPGRDAFTTSGRYKVPAKATGSSGYELPPGLRLPIVVRDPASSDFDIDWKAFNASPDRKAAVKKAAADRSSAEATAYTNSVPGMKEQTWAASREALPLWMDMVRNGQLKRKNFDRDLNTLVRIGQMQPDLADWGKQTLDSEGFV